MALALAALVTMASGCGWNKYSQTEITVKYSGETFMHVTHLPQTMEDGEPADEAQAELLEDLAEYAEAWTLLPATGAVVREKGQTPEREEVYLLMVEGPREVAMVIWESLRDDYDLARPWLVSLPTQALARMTVPQQPAEETTADATEGE
jgi:hypothetical protein